MWPRLSAEELLHDLFGSPPLLRLAAKGLLVPRSSACSTGAGDPRWQRSLSRRPMRRWSTKLGCCSVPASRRAAARTPVARASAEPRTYGHIVVDEAQDLSPMQLRMVGRRSLSGSVTVVGDIGQATGPWAADRWDDVTAHLPAAASPAPGRAVGELPHAGRGDGGRLPRPCRGGPVPWHRHGRAPAHGWRRRFVASSPRRLRRGRRRSPSARGRAAARDGRRALPGIARRPSSPLPSTRRESRPATPGGTGSGRP